MSMQCPFSLHHAEFFQCNLETRYLFSQFLFGISASNSDTESSSAYSRKRSSPLLEPVSHSFRLRDRSISSLDWLSRRRVRCHYTDFPSMCKRVRWSCRVVGNRPWKRFELLSLSSFRCLRNSRCDLRLEIGRTQWGRIRTFTIVAISSFPLQNLSTWNSNQWS